MEVTLYSRPGCHLCDEAREVLQAERLRTPFELREVDISTSDQLELEYGIRVPVVELNGTELYEITVDPQGLAAALKEAGA